MGDSSSQSSGNELEYTRRGPWTVEEDFILMNYISIHGEGRWNSLATSAGLKRSGKSCRFRWLNYLSPDVRRGNITLQEQLLILQLHSRWGNSWSKIAQHLPGRTDNEIKNYWRTKVQKQATQLKCDVNSKQFKDIMHYIWMPRLIERIQATAASIGSATPSSATTNYGNNGVVNHLAHFNNYGDMNQVNQTSFTPEDSSTTCSTDTFGGTQVVSPVSDLNDCYNHPVVNQSRTNHDYYQANQSSGYEDSLTSPASYFNQGSDRQAMDQNNQWMDAGNASDCLWNIDNSWFLQQH